ncbi:zinc ribbon domain-containing protein [Halorhodospira halochloris]|uniref:FmdB family zinc ribbon protein n=1 Tax=Halorhodospira halochloris TaxID=1052 RepID=UPI001EE98094|nr:zinc ribbon domain-containing protein [Halorhodospira halochloris]MCG5529721.1 zinc ribbon domain-containing protein [Halorhodospira halochloris]
MPIYEYQCNSCGHRLEAIQAVSDEPLSYCPECQEAQLKRLVSAVAFQLKGTGWYETDFKNKGRGAANKPDSEGATDADKSADASAGSTNDASAGSAGAGSNGAGQQSSGAKQQDSAKESSSRSNKEASASN